MRQLSYSAPRREWFMTGNGWSSRPWTADARAEVALGGGWFSGGEDKAENIATAPIERVIATCRCDKHKRSS